MSEPATAPDAVVIGAGVVGLTLARELHRAGLRVLVVERARAGRGASGAAAGMLAAHQTRHPALRPLTLAAAAVYPEFVAELESDTGLEVGYLPTGTIRLEAAGGPRPPSGWEALDRAALGRLEPALAAGEEREAWWIPGDHSVDNRALLAALLEDLRRREIPLLEDAPVISIRRDRFEGWITTTRDRAIPSAVVVNAAGAWAANGEGGPLGMSSGHRLPIRPRKGQMLGFECDAGLRHVVVAPGVYLVPRRGRRVLVGATVEDVGFRPGVDAAALDALYDRARGLVPTLHPSRFEERWFGYRPAAADELPVLGALEPGCWVAGGHFRDGILLAPLTARLLAAAIAAQNFGGAEAPPTLQPFSPQRFGTEAGRRR